jgi:hypothetical protein
MMTHGMTILPNLLSSNVTASLRQYIVTKNAQIQQDETYPVSQGEYRLSYGIQPTEHESVSNAIRQVATHPQLRYIVQALLGDFDPASTEITAITNYYQARDQAWHQDTKQDGNAIKFARTFSHSYSLFIPLQDTTHAMGITDVCPGTHYCTNDIAVACEENKFSLADWLYASSTQTTPTSGGNHHTHYVPAGYGALLNQHVWHRGAAHTDPNAPERIVFIMSFLARPNLDTDPRQLSRGTYFHQKWMNWGHTWQDLVHAESSMRWTFAVLRCLSIWKPKYANWGYDLITATVLRFANEQLEEDDLVHRLWSRLDQIGFPTFLRGRILENVSQKQMWHFFIRETMEKVYVFCKLVTVYVHVAYFGFVGTMAILIAYKFPSGSRKAFRLVRDAVRRVVFTHGIVLLVAYKLWYDIQHSPWGQSIISGRAFMRPFPVAITETDSTALDFMISNGRTTMPTRNDVLIGTRYDAQFLGSYDRWLDYHPGNVQFLQTVSQYATIWEPDTTWNIVSTIMKKRDEDGRFLQQDFRTGDWRIMNECDIAKTFVEYLVIAKDPALATIRKQIHWMLADNRFGPQRSTALARWAQLQLWNLKRALLQMPDDNCFASFPVSKDSTVSLPAIDPLHKSWTTFFQRQTNTAPFHPRPNVAWMSLDNKQDFRIGSLVWCYIHDADAWYPGTVVAVGDDDDDDDLYEVSFDDSGEEYFEETGNMWIHREDMQKFHPITEGDAVEGCFMDSLNDCWPGTVDRVMPSGFISILYDDGDYQEYVPPTRYYQPPFNYEGPFFY